jgi:hypothetical protein
VADDLSFFLLKILPFLQEINSIEKRRRVTMLRADNNFNMCIRLAILLTKGFLDYCVAG